MLVARRNRFVTNVAALYAGAAAPSFSTWDPGNKNASISLSNGNLTAANASGGWNAIKSTASNSSGKLHAEFSTSLTTTQNMQIGVGNASAGLSSPLDANANSLGWYTPSGGGSVGGSASGTVDTPGWPSASGQIAAIEIDFTAGQLWFWNPAAGHWYGSSGITTPGTNGFAIPTGALFLMAAFSGTSLDITVNTGGSAFSVTPTAGFSAWG